VDLTVNLGPGAGPYNYSDMTGFVAVTGRGSWTVIYDSGIMGTPWGVIDWNREPQGRVPPGTSLTVQARSANTIPGLTAVPFTAVSNGADTPFTGRYIEIQAILVTDVSGTLSPVLSDLSVQSEVQNQACFVDADADVDVDDIALIAAARNQPALAGDPRDPDGNGIINVVDSRACALRCTRPGCAR
jgi:hypothetical protein